MADDRKVNTAAAYVTKKRAFFYVFAFHNGVIEEIHINLIAACKRQTAACIVKHNLRGILAGTLCAESITEVGLRFLQNVGAEVGFHLLKLRNEILILCTVCTNVIFAAFIQNKVEELGFLYVVTTVAFRVFCGKIYFVRFIVHDLIVFVSVIVVAIYTEQPRKLVGINRFCVQRNTKRIVVSSFLHLCAKGNQFVPRCRQSAYACICHSVFVYKPRRLQIFSIQNIRTGIRTNAARYVCRSVENTAPHFLLTCIRVRFIDCRIHVYASRFTFIKQVTLYNIPIRLRVNRLLVEDFCVLFRRKRSVEVYQYCTAVKTFVFFCQSLPTCFRAFENHRNVNTAFLLFDVCNVR